MRIVFLKGIKRIFNLNAYPGKYKVHIKKKLTFKMLANLCEQHRTQFYHEAFFNIANITASKYNILTAIQNGKMKRQHTNLRLDAKTNYNTLSATIIYSQS